MHFQQVLLDELLPALFQRLHLPSSAQPPNTDLTNNAYNQLFVFELFVTIRVHK